MSPNDTDGMANSVDPDQTAPLRLGLWLGLGLGCTVCPGLAVRKLRIITVITNKLNIYIYIYIYIYIFIYLYLYIYSSLLSRPSCINMYTVLCV